MGNMYKEQRDYYMEEKIFNLLETMYSDLTNRIDNIDKELKDLKSNSAAKHDLVRLENKIDQIIRHYMMDIN